MSECASVCERSQRNVEIVYAWNCRSKVHNQTGSDHGYIRFGVKFA